MRSIKWGRCSARGQLVWKSRNRSLTSTLFLSRSAAAGLLAVSPTLYKALEAGNPVDAEAGGIAADSLAPRRVGALMFPIAKTYVSGVALVTDDEIRGAQEDLWKVLRIVAEPGGAAAFAALFSGRYHPKPQERVGVLVCGANTVAVNFDS
jgi:threonine dehydratase